MMGGDATRNMQRSLQKYNKLYIVASCCIYIGITGTLHEDQNTGDGQNNAVRQCGFPFTTWL